MGLFHFEQWKGGKWKTLVDTIKSRQLVWYGHIMTMNKNRLLKTIHNWMAIRRRNMGRPQKRWKKGTKLPDEKGT